MFSVKRYRGKEVEGRAREFFSALFSSFMFTILFHSLRCFFYIVTSLCCFFYDVQIKMPSGFNGYSINTCMLFV